MNTNEKPCFVCVCVGVSLNFCCSLYVCLHTLALATNLTLLTLLTPSNSRMHYHHRAQFSCDSTANYGRYEAFPTDVSLLVLVPLIRLQQFADHLALVALLPHLVLFMPANMQHKRRRCRVSNRAQQILLSSP